MTVTSRYIMLNFYVFLIMFARAQAEDACSRANSISAPVGPVHGLPQLSRASICGASILGCRAPSRERAEAIYVHMHRVRCICHNIDIVHNSASASP